MEKENESLTRDMFLVSLLHFREVMCSTKYTIDQKDEAFGNLTTDYFRCKLTEEDAIHYTSIAREWETRRLYESFKTVI